MDREGHGGARGGGTGTADPVDANPGDAGGCADAETLPSPYPSRPGARPFPPRMRPSLAAVARQLGVLACYLAVGVAVPWPRAAYLAGSLPSTRDAAAYVWGFWWVARQLTHLGNPWATGYL